jgi:NADH-quinone oxidoreductase subunit B
VGGLIGLLGSSRRGLAYFPVGGSCCLPELATGEPQAFQECGWIRAASPRQADLLLISGPMNAKLAPVIRHVFEQVPPPRRVVLVGTCAQADYTRTPDVNDLLRQAIQVPGCPVEPAAVVRAVAVGGV